MVIRRMNNVLVKHNKILFGLFSLIIIVAFVWFFTPGVDGSMFFNRRASDGTVVGRAAGRDITLKEYRAALDKQAAVMALAYNTSPAMFQESSSDEMFARVILAEVAKKYGLTASDKEVVDFIKAFPQFKDAKGNFDNTKYSAFIEKNLVPHGIDAKDLEEAVRTILAANKLGKMMDGSVVSDDEVEKFMDMTMEKTSARMIVFKAADYRKNVKISDKEISAYYEANKTKLLTEPRLRGLFVKFAYDTYAKKNPVKLAEANKYYEANKIDFIKDGKQQPFAKVSGQIMKKLTAEKAEAAAMNDARKLRDKLYFVSGETEGAGQIAHFKKYAVESRCTMLDTGWLDKKAVNVEHAGKEPLLVSAIFATSERYPVTKSVRGNTGVYVACVTQRIPAKIAEFKDVKEQIRTLLTDRKAKALAEEAARTYAAKVAASKTPAAETANALKNTKGIVVRLPEFSYDTLNEFNKENNIDKYIAMNLIPGTATGALSRSADIPAGGKLMVFVDRRVAPAAADRAKAKSAKQEFYARLKKTAAVSGFQSWIFSNSANLMKQNEQQNARK